MTTEEQGEVVEVIAAGFYSVIQDLGRKGWTHFGISPGGAADPVALDMGNRLVSNHPSAAAVEMTAAGGRFRFLRPAWIAVTGGECRPTMNSQSVPMWTSIFAQKGETLSIGNIESGFRSYLCIHGGIDSPVTLGSRSSSADLNWAGLGRALQSGDRLHVGGQDCWVPGFRRASLSLRRIYRTNEWVLRVTAGPQRDSFPDAVMRIFLESKFGVAPESNGRGLRLVGEACEALRGVGISEMTSEGVALGAIQVTPSGQPIVLLAEQQTTGGYPKIANVIRSDLFRLGQIRSGSIVGFELVSLEDAWRINREFELLCNRALT